MWTQETLKEKLADFFLLISEAIPTDRSTEREGVWRTPMNGVLRDLKRFGGSRGRSLLSGNIGWTEFSSNHFRRILTMRWGLIVLHLTLEKPLRN
jgi:hypothetical protein